MTAYAGDLTPQEAWDLLASNPDAKLIDVRTEAEWRFVGVPVTEDLDREPIFIEWTTFPDGEMNHRFLSELQEAGPKPGDTAPLIFICRSGQRSIGAAVAATEADLGPSYNVLEGFEGIQDEHGHRGWQGWKAAGLPWRQ